MLTTKVDPRAVRATSTFCHLPNHLGQPYIPLKTSLKNSLQRSYIPVNTKYMYNMYTMLDQRRRRWANVVKMLYNVLCLLGCGHSVHA